MFRSRDNGDSSHVASDKKASAAPRALTGKGTGKPASSKPSFRIRPLRVVRDLALLAGFIAILFAGAYLRDRWTPAEEAERDLESLRPIFNEAHEALNNGDVETAVARSRELVHLKAENGHFWILYGRSLHAAEDFEKAVFAFESAETFNQFEGIANYLMAKSHFRLGDVETGLRCLALADRESYRPRKSVKNDPDFQAAKDDERFKRVARSLDYRNRFYLDD